MGSHPLARLVRKTNSRECPPACLSVATGSLACFAEMRRPPRAGDFALRCPVALANLVADSHGWGSPGHAVAGPGGEGKALRARPWLGPQCSAPAGRGKEMCAHGIKEHCPCRCEEVPLAQRAETAAPALRGHHRGLSRSRASSLASHGTRCRACRCRRVRRSRRLVGGCPRGAGCHSPGYRPGGVVIESLSGSDARGKARQRQR
jgi:hypothetical protein